MHRSKILAGLFSNEYVNANISCIDGRQLQDNEISAIIALLAQQLTTATSRDCPTGFLSNSLHLLMLSIQGGDGIKSLPIFSDVKATRLPGTIAYTFDLTYNPTYLYLVDLLEKKINLHLKQQQLITPLAVINNDIYPLSLKMQNSASREVNRF